MRSLEALERVVIEEGAAAVVVAMVGAVVEREAAAVGKVVARAEAGRQ